METTDTPDLQHFADQLLIPETEEAEPVETEEVETEATEAAPVDQTAEEAPEDEGTAEEVEEEEEAPQVYTVKVDGQDVAVTLEDLTRDFSGRQAIQKRFEEAARVRKEIETTAQEIQAQREALIAFAQEIQTKGVISAPQPPDPSKAQKDPIGYIQELSEYQAKAAEYQHQQQQLEAFERQTQAEQQKQLAALREAEARKLIEAIPDLADPNKGERVRASLLRAASDYGYSSDEIGQVMDSRALRVLHDAAKWRELQAGKAVVAQKVAAAKPVLKPTAKPANPAANQVKSLKSRLKQTGSIDAAVDLLFVKGA